MTVFIGVVVVWLLVAVLLGLAIGHLIGSVR
jgi:hypothetical protein